MARVTLFRKTPHPLIPARHTPTPRGQYDLYPAFALGSGVIEMGYDALARRIGAHRVVTIDGYCGVLWVNFQEQLDQALRAYGLRTAWVDITTALRSYTEIEVLVAPFLGSDDPLFGRRFSGHLRDFFEVQKLEQLAPDSSADVSLLYGCGAALAGWEGLLIYVDVPKNEIQYRARAQAVGNLGTDKPLGPKPHYKRSYFVDWPALNAHKAELLPRIDLIVDEQRPDQPMLMSGETLRRGLYDMSRNAVRPRPWFEPGPWGGQWMKRTLSGLPQDVPNLAWSFELIAPENGLCFESEGNLLEVSFDMLMFVHHREILGDYADYFGDEFPIRFDFLDTVEGGPLSVQCHPRPEYIRRHFGETFTQDETYYILDCAPGATVYLGFRDDIDPAAFHSVLEKSFREAAPIKVEHFVTVLPAHKHDLFLIPNGTIHCSGAGNLVLEISATPYLFTFKMYDWMRLDLDGRPRPLNIDRAFDNLHFDRKGRHVKDELVARQHLIAQDEGWQLVHLPTHREHFYDVQRYEFDDRVTIASQGSVHVLMLVEGHSLIVETQHGQRQRFNYAETFIVPAAAGQYTLINEGLSRAKVVKAFIKPDWFTQEDHQWLTRKS